MRHPAELSEIDFNTLKNGVSSQIQDEVSLLTITPAELRRKAVRKLIINILTCAARNRVNLEGLPEPLRIYLFGLVKNFKRFERPKDDEKKILCENRNKLAEKNAAFIRKVLIQTFNLIDEIELDPIKPEEVPKIWGRFKLLYDQLGPAKSQVEEVVRPPAISLPLLDEGESILSLTFTT